MEEAKDCYVDVDFNVDVDVDVDVGGEEKGRKYSEKENIFFLEENKNRVEKEKEENILRR